jgi:hypothetical protein
MKGKYEYLKGESPATEEMYISTVSMNGKDMHIFYRIVFDSIVSY